MGGLVMNCLLIIIKLASYWFDNFFLTMPTASRYTLTVYMMRTNYATYLLYDFSPKARHHTAFPDMSAKYIPF
ncbi:hypothetical protein BH09BAC1_BH09BAC1_00390 [soil metagenome]